MPAKSSSERRFPNPEKRVDWFLTADAHAQGVGEWDIKAGQLADAVLQILSAGSAVMFGVTSDGGAVSVTIFDGDSKQRRYLTDSVELDDWSDAILGTAKRLHLGRFASGNGKEVS